MTTYAPCDSADPKCTGSGASEGGTTVQPLIVSIAGEPKGHGGPPPVAALATVRVSARAWRTSSAPCTRAPSREDLAGLLHDHSEYVEEGAQQELMQHAQRVA